MPAPAHHPPAFSLRSRRIVTPAGTLAGTVVVQGQTVTHIIPDEADSDPRAALPENVSADDVTDLGNLALLPGFIDAHVHLNDPRLRPRKLENQDNAPGTNEPWEGFATGTRAAIAAGITTVADMPLNSLPVTTTLDALQQKRAAAQNNFYTDVGFYAGLVPGNLEELPGLLNAGVAGVKCFLCDSGLPEFPAVDHATLVEGMAMIAAHPRRVPLLAHAERVHDLACSLAAADPRKYASWLASRPSSFEQRAVAELLELVADTRCPLHIVHVADADTLGLIRAAKDAGLPVTAETCPHYLAFSSDEVPNGDTRFKCAPPIREARHRAALWEALCDGTLDFVASDHSPCPPAMKHLDTGDFFRGWGGIASLQLGPAVTWTHAVAQGFTLDDFARWWSHAPGKLLNFPAGISSGGGANLVAFDPDAVWKVDAPALHHRHAVTPYDGMTLRGEVRQVWLRGTPVVQAGVVSKAAHGRESRPDKSGRYA